MPPRRRWLASAGLAALAPVVRAAPGGLPSQIDHDGTSPEFERLRQHLFGQRPLLSGPASQVQLQVPLRAAYGASVPVKVLPRFGAQTAALAVRRYTLLVDKNPSPVAATIELGPAIAVAELETRLRVDEYGHLRVVAELSDGSLHLASRYVKVSGGCSAPPNRDHPERIGQTRFRLPEGLHADGSPTVAELTVVHPNDTGFELNQVTVMYIPPHFVRRLRARLDEALLFDMDCDFSVSENPSWRFVFRSPPGGAGRLLAEVEDSKEQRFSGALDLRSGVAS